MSAELMKSKFIHHPSSFIRVAIISEHVGQISFKFQLLLPLGHAARCLFFFLIWKKNAFSNFSGMSRSSCLYHQSSWNQNLSVVCHPSPMLQLSQNHLSRFLSHFTCSFSGPYNFFFLTTNAFIIFVNMRPYGSKHFQTLLLSPITFKSFQLFLRIFFSVVLRKGCWIFEIWRLRFLRYFFSKISISPLYPMKKVKGER